MSMLASHDILNAQQIADMMGVSVKTVRRQAKQGQLPFIRRLGRRWVAHRDAIKRWMGADGGQW